MRDATLLLSQTDGYHYAHAPKGHKLTPVTMHADKAIQLINETVDMLKIRIALNDNYRKRLADGTQDI